MNRRFLLKLIFSASFLGFPVQLISQTSEVSPIDHPGLIIYQQHCASCHSNAEIPRAHTLETLQTMSKATLEFALNEGIMYAQASTLAAADKTALVEFLATEEDNSWVANMMCSKSTQHVDLDQTIHLASYGVDASNSRNLDSSIAGLNNTDIAAMELAWAIGFPDTGALRSAPVLVGETLFYAANGTRKVFALNSKTGCAKWVFDSPTRLRSSLTYGALGADGKKAILYGDAEGFVYALDAADGTQIWVQDVRSHNRSVRVTGAPVLIEDRVIVPISNSGVAAGADPTFECCVGHGAVTALQASSGDILWEYHTMPEAQYTGEVNSAGTKLRGPSGAPIWTTPSIDLKRRTVYVTSGENTSHPATETSDAIIALDLDTGEQKWLFQGLALDVWNMACGRNSSSANCPNQKESTLKDYDFGGPAILVERDQSDILLAGQKSGDLWALDPENGQLLWNQKIGTGTALGGNHWGITTDGNRVFLPINDPGAARPGFVPRPGMYSFFVGTGESSWSVPSQPDCENGRADRVSNCQTRYGLSAAPMLVGDALLSGSLDGKLVALNKNTGATIWQYDTAVEFETSNGVSAKGGSIDAHSIAAGGGMIFVGSGYGRFGQTPGNVLLAFKPKTSPTDPAQ